MTSYSLLSVICINRIRIFNEEILWELTRFSFIEHVHYLRLCILNRDVNMIRVLKYNTRFSILNKREVKGKTLILFRTF